MPQRLTPCLLAHTYNTHTHTPQMCVYVCIAYVGESGATKAEEALISGTYAQHTHTHTEYTYTYTTEIGLNSPSLSAPRSPPVGSRNNRRVLGPSLPHPKIQGAGTPSRICRMYPHQHVHPWLPADFSTVYGHRAFGRGK